MQLGGSQQNNNFCNDPLQSLEILAAAIFRSRQIEETQGVVSG